MITTCLLYTSHELLFENAGLSLEVLESGKRLVAPGDHGLTLAVVAEAGDLQNSGEEAGAAFAQVLFAVHGGKVGMRQVVLTQEVLFGDTVLADADRFCRWADGGEFVEIVERAGRDVLELGADRRACLLYTSRCV